MGRCETRGHLAQQSLLLDAKPVQLLVGVQLLLLVGGQPPVDAVQLVLQQLLLGGGALQLEAQLDALVVGCGCEAGESGQVKLPSGLLVKVKKSRNLVFQCQA